MQTNKTQLWCKTRLCTQRGLTMLHNVVSKEYLKLLSKTLHVVFVELHDVFHKLLNRDGLHVICRGSSKNSKCPLCHRFFTHLQKLKKFVTLFTFTRHHYISETGRLFLTKGKDKKKKKITKWPLSQTPRFWHFELYRKTHLSHLSQISSKSHMRDLW